MVLDTGCTAIGEPEMTFRISPGRRLPLERFAQFAVPRLQLLKEADTLDGNHSPVRERPQQRDLPLREGPLNPSGGSRSSPAEFPLVGAGSRGLFRQPAS